MEQTPTSSELRRALRERQHARQTSCLPCRERKVRCDRQQPCSVCVKRDHPDLCVFAGSTPSNRRRQELRRLSSSPVGGPRQLETFSPAPARDRATSSRAEILASNSLIDLARRFIPSSGIDATSQQAAVEDAVRPLLGLEDGGGDKGTWSQSHPSLPSDQEMLRLFSFYRTRVHPFQFVVDDLDGVESRMCAIINSRAGFTSDDATSSTPTSQSASLLCLLHAILAAGAQFSDMAPSKRSTVARRHAAHAFDMLKMHNFGSPPDYLLTQAMLILGHVQLNDGKPQGAWILGGSIIRMASVLGLAPSTMSASASRRLSLASSSSIHRGLRLAIIWQDALLSLAFNRRPAAYDLDEEADLPSLSGPPATRLTYRQAMNWICHLTLQYWTPTPRQSDPSSLTRLHSFFERIDSVDRSLQEHLQRRQSCHSIQAIQEHHSLELHKSFTISALCRPILSVNVRSTLPEGDAEVILTRLKSALKRSVKALIHLRSVSGHATRSWAFVHNGLTSALLLGFIKETRVEDESWTIQGDLIQSLAENEDPFAVSEPAANASGQLSGVLQKSLSALKSLRRLAEEERERPNGQNVRDERGDAAPTELAGDPMLSFDAMDMVQDPGSTDFDDLFRSFDFTTSLPMEAFDYITTDPMNAGATFQPPFVPNF